MRRISGQYLSSDRATLKPKPTGLLPMVQKEILEFRSGILLTVSWEADPATLPLVLSLFNTVYAFLGFSNMARQIKEA